MVGLFLVNHSLDALGTVFLCTIIWKIARGYPISRWFF